MEVKFYGTRGSVPVSGKDFNKYGGNTTSLAVVSSCLPKNRHLAIDAGSGFVPLSLDMLREYGSRLTTEGLALDLFFTHFHHDHTQGLPLSPLTFTPSVEMNLFGPVDSSIGPQEMMAEIIRPPFFPVHNQRIGGHFNYQNLEFHAAKVIIYHPVGGLQVLCLEEFQKTEKESGHVSVGTYGKYPIKECLIIRMFKSNHPDQTISYRLEERPTGKVFVFLTDHENQPGIPDDLRQHLSGADLLVMVAQFSQQKYSTRACGWGHGSGHYCAWLAWQCGVKRVGLTHHDPFSSDEEVETILAEARATLEQLKRSEPDNPSPLTADKIFACADYQTEKI